MIWCLQVMYWTAKMVIEIINDNVINGMPLSEESNDVIQKDPLKKVCIISLQNIILQYTLDFKQSVAFDVMASSFILNHVVFPLFILSCIIVR